MDKELRKQIREMRPGERKEVNNILFERNYYGSYNIFCGKTNNVYEITDSINWSYDFKFKHLIELLKNN